MLEAKVNTILGFANLIEGFGEANIILLREIRFTIDNVLSSSQSKRNLLSCKDKRHNGYHIETNRKNGIKSLYIISTVSNEKRILEKLSVLSSGLYYTHMMRRIIENSYELMG